jgi:hypothetical protein
MVGSGKVGSRAELSDVQSTSQAQRQQDVSGLASRLGGSSLEEQVGRRTSSPRTRGSPFDPAEMDEMRRIMSPTRQGRREKVISRFPPPKVIGFGIESEIVGARYMREGLPVKLSVGRMAGNDVQTDQPMHAPDTTYPELVEMQEPVRMTHVQVMHDVLAGPMRYADNLVAETLGKGKDETTVGEVVAHANPEYAGLGIKMDRPLPLVGLQASYSVPPGKMGELLAADSEYHPDARKAVERIERRLAEMPDLPPYEFSEDVRGFLMHEFTKMMEAGTPQADPSPVTPHTHFAFMNRTAASWQYYMNLRTPRERAAVRGALMKVSDERQTLMSEALMEADEPPCSDYVFARPYLGPVRPDGSVGTFRGPKRDDYFASIIKGPLDSLTDLEGYGVDAIGGWITGDLDMRAAGIEDRGRGDRMQPSVNVMDHSVLDLYEKAARFNPRLDKPSRSPSETLRARTQVVRMTKAVQGFNDVYGLLRRTVKQAEPGKDAGELFGEVFKTNEEANEALFMWDDYLSMKSGDSWNEVKDAFAEVEEYLQRDPVEMRIDELSPRLDRFGLALWDCDLQGGGRQARMAQRIAQLKAQGAVG